MGESGRRSVERIRLSWRMDCWSICCCRSRGCAGGNTVTYVSEVMEMIHNLLYHLKCPRCSYEIRAKYGIGFLGYPGDRTLKDDILAGCKGDEAKSIMERYPESECRYISHFFRCPKCNKLSSCIRTIIYEKKGWYNDYNLFTEKLICPDSIQDWRKSPGRIYIL